VTEPAVSDFDCLKDAYYDAWLRFHPETAVEVGEYRHAGTLRACGDDEIAALVVLNEKLLAGLDELHTGGLDADRLIDLELMRGAAYLEIEALTAFDWRRRDPQAYLPLNAVYQLTIRPLSNFPAALIALLEAVPGYLREARQRLLADCEQVPAEWLESAHTAATAGADYLRGLERHPKVGAHRKRLRELPARLQAAVAAVNAYADFLEREIGPRAAGSFAVGGRRYGHLLRYRHFLEVEIDDLHHLGVQLFEQTQRDLRRVCRELSGNEDVAALNRRLQAERPEPTQLIETYQAQMKAARGFVAEHKLVTMPDPETLSVVATPSFLHHQIPFAAYMEPAPNDPAQQGYYYVTPASDEDALAEHHLAGIPHTCVHEAYPGHHLQFVTANLKPAASTLPRLLNTSATLYEGWALYCEQLMQEQGFLDRPEQRFVLLKDRLWRALRIIIDVEIQTRDRDLEQASALMQRHLGFPPAQAMADLNWYTHAPATPMGYATGWALINATRDRLRAERREPGMRDFHDRLLSCGSIALPLVLRRAFGEDFEAGVRGMIFTRPPGESASFR
jgi:uncharacterized protein (DUF885 family)